MKDGLSGGHTRNPSPLVNQALVLLSERKFGETEALCRDAPRSDPSHPAILHLLGLSLMEQAKHEEAAAAFRQALREDPTRPDLNYSLALALQGVGQTDAAIKRLRIAISVSPEVAQFHAKLGQLLSAQGELEAARESLGRALVLRPGSASTLLNLSQVQLDLGSVNEAEESIRSVLKSTPDDPAANQALGRLQQHLGRFEEASSIFQNVIDADPHLAAPYFSICYSSRVTESSRPLLERMLEMTEDHARSLDDLSLLHYALGKSFDDLAEYEAAMKHFDKANECCQTLRARAGRRFDRNVYSSNLDRMIEFCGKQDSRPALASRPVFIVGMIRSGTTLVEQVLASHPAVAAGGELGYWVSTVTGTLAGKRTQHATPAWLDEAVAGYEKVLSGISPEAERVADKMPTNYQVLGAILRAYPRAKVIHCRRNAVDNCLSIYVTPNRRAPDFAHDRGDIVFAYREYERLMAHWRLVFPDAEILDVSYEELTADFGAVARSIVDFVGLDWNEACAKPSESTRPVNTPSQWQVRQPVYRSSVDRWRNYEPWLGSLRSLGPSS